MNKFLIVFIDDNFSETSPLVQTLDVVFPEADVHNIFQNPDEGVEFVLNNLEKRMIVFIDWNYSGTSKKGISLLKTIRKKTSLLYVIMMSANQVRLNSQMQNADIVEMMNEENFYYFDSSTKDNSDAVELVQTIIDKWESRFDCVLEQWLIRHPDDKYKVVMRQEGTDYTWDDILKEVRMQTKIGRDFERKANQSTIYRYINYESTCKGVDSI